MKQSPTIVYEDDALLAINKPAGLLVHPTGSDDDEATLVDWLLDYDAAIAEVGDNPDTRPGIVHRLDRNTSGVMLVARTQEAFSHLKQQFKERTVKKWYTALVAGRPDEQSGTINLPIARVGIKRVTPKQGRTKATGERDAVTHWNVETPLSGYTLLNVQPQTGRTNQIRVHLAAINHPIACDTRYGGRNVACPTGLTRPFLHSRAIEFQAPDGSRLRLAADLPDDLRAALKALEQQE